MATRVLRLAVRTGWRYTAVWRQSDGARVMTTMARDEYEALAGQGANRPPGGDASWAWLWAYEQPVLDTLSRDIEPGLLLRTEDLANWRYPVENAGQWVATTPRGRLVRLDPARLTISGTAPELTVVGDLQNGITIMAGVLDEP